MSRFLVSDTSKGLDQARGGDCGRASQGRDLSKAAGVQLGRAEWIMEDISKWSPVPKLAHAQAAPLPIASGEDRRRTKVTVGFEIAR
jgi:uncharacterized protein YggE